MFQAHFESEKNKKAFLYTVAICGTLLLLSFIIAFKIEKVKPAVAQDLMEINLGNNEEGFGEEQPLVKGDMNDNASPQPAPPQINNTTAADNSEEPKPDDDAEEDAAPVTKTTTPNKTPKPNVTPANKPVTKPTTPAPQTVLAPKPPKPVATYKGPGNGKGNGATEDNGFRYQGNKPGGQGDAGDPSGKPDSYGNTPGGRSGVTVTRGARPINLGSLRFEDEFNEDAKVYLDINYNAAGAVTSTAVARGTTTGNTKLIAIAKRKAAQLKFPPTASGGVSTVLFNLKVNQ
jgi:hypothetical protein